MASLESGRGALRRHVTELEQLVSGRPSEVVSIRSSFASGAFASLYRSADTRRPSRRSEKQRGHMDLEVLIVQEIVRAHDKRSTDVKSTPEKTVFSVYLPVTV